MKRKMQLAKLPDNWNSEREMGSRQGNTIEPFLRFSVPEKKNILRGEQKKKEVGRAPTKKAFDDIVGQLHRKLLSSR